MKKPWKRIEIFHEMVNLVPHIKNIVASPRFMLIQSDNQIISACQHTGIQIAQISSEKFNEICLFDDKDANQILIAIKRDEIKVIELNQCGFIVSDVFSLRRVFRVNYAFWLVNEWLVVWKPGEAQAVLLKRRWEAKQFTWRIWMGIFGFQNGHQSKSFKDLYWMAI